MRGERVADQRGSRAEIVKWVAQSLRPFSVVRDPGFLSLMKTGRPGYYVPSPSTVSRDVKTVFARTRVRIAQLLRVSRTVSFMRAQTTHTTAQDYDGKLSFGTDAWTSPNHRAFIAISVHLEVDGQPLRLLLDLVELAEVRTCNAAACA